MSALSNTAADGSRRGDVSSWPTPAGDIPRRCGLVYAGLRTLVPLTFGGRGPTSLGGEAAATAFLGARRPEAVCKARLNQRRAARGNYPGKRLICGVRLCPNYGGVKPACDRPSLQRHGRSPVPLRSRGSVVAGQILLPLEHGVRLGLFRHLAGQRLGLLQVGSVFGGLFGYLLGHNRLIVFFCH